MVSESAPPVVTWVLSKFFLATGNVKNITRKIIEEFKNQMSDNRGNAIPIMADIANAAIKRGAE
ncbi:MAG TPA: hypothetical protein PKI31_03240 [Spirochaetota bacterium]|nr:hypothetical protein [Spirochaetota bacterium]